MTACDGCLRRSALLEMVAPMLHHALHARAGLAEILALDDEELMRAVCGRRRAEVERSLAGVDPRRIRRTASERRLEVLCVHDPAYPAHLGDAPDAPRALFLHGDLTVLELLSLEPAVAVVGSRQASPYGLEMARALGRDLAERGVPVVSGMALGADSAAHEGALEAGGPTVAVLPGGADRPYPRSKQALHGRIARNGLVLSEMPPGFVPVRMSFPARNRIMAALAAMTVVVEGTTGSGSLITADLATELGREVGAVPGRATSRLAAGPNGLIADGAVLVTGCADILTAVYGPGREPAPSGPPRNLDARLARVLDAVEQGRASPDEIAGSGGAPSDALADLTELELLGLVRRDAAGRYGRCA